MCGRVTFLTIEELEAVVDALASGGELRLQSGVAREQGRPRSKVHAIVPHGEQLELELFSWGFRPTKSTDVVFNTRIESAMSGTPLWEGPIRDGRCILPVASFFEPHRSKTALNPRTGKPAKLQFEFTDPYGAPLLLASIHDGRSLSVLTTKPNGVVAPVHARMPLVLRAREVPVWLEGGYATLADRSGVELDVAQEDNGLVAEPPQLSLF